MFASLRADFHFALRQFPKSSGFAITAICTLALGIGTTTAIYSLIDDARLVSRSMGMGGAVLPICPRHRQLFRHSRVLPNLGRNFTADDDHAGHQVVSSHLWIQGAPFPSTENALGGSILISDVPYTIVGVMPNGFLEPRGNDQAEVWTSFAPFVDGSAPRGEKRDGAIAAIIGAASPASHSSRLAPT